MQIPSWLKWWGGNKYNTTMFGFFGGGEAKYDANKINYIENGYNVNPFVYSVVSSRANKFSAIPFEIKEIQDEKSRKEYNNLIKSTKYNLSPIQKNRLKELRNKAYGQFKNFKLENPNPIQSWNEFIELFETYLATCGEVYIYKLTPESGPDKGKPIALYLLPSHYMEIVMKNKWKREDLENPVKSYMLIEGDQYTEFKPEEVIHVKYANPNYDIQGTLLYGQSPLRACYKNIVSSNEALGLNIKTMKNGGAFGIIHAKGQTGLTEAQAKALKEKLVEMDSGSGRLDKIAGVSTEIGFTRLSLNADELKPFDYLQFDEKQICNALGWDAKLLNNDQGAKYDNYKLAQKRVLINTIVPDADIFVNTFNKYILPLFPEYKGTEMCYDISDLPEMQEDMEMLVNWVSKANDKGMMTKNEGREALGLPKIEDPLMDEITCIDDVLTLEQSLDDFPSVTNE